MTKTEADKAINRLKNACTYQRFDEPGVVEEYTKALLKLNYKRTMEIVDEIIEENSEHVPAISKIIGKYKSERNRIIVANKEYCPTCDDNGFIVLKEVVKIGETKEGNAINGTYEFAYYCPFCDMGIQFAFDGSKCKEKSPYKMPAITEILPEELLDDIRKKNIEKKKCNNDNKTLRNSKAELKRTTATIGKAMPDMPYWWKEGDANEEMD